MRQLTAFMRKEWMGQIRTGNFWIFLVLFSLFGIMNPAMAKMTPWLYEMMADSMAEQGLVIQSVEVTALTSWQQYYKNISMMLIVLVVMASGILVGEYQKGTLVQMLTKGLARWKVIVAKSVVEIGVWTICYWLAFGITYGYTVYFWDNSIAVHWLASGAFIYILGIWLIALLFLASVFANSQLAVLLITGIVFGGCYVIEVIPATSRFSPVKLLSAGNLLNGSAKLGEFKMAVIMAVLSSICFWMAAVIGFNKKNPEGAG